MSHQCFAWVEGRTPALDAHRCRANAQAGSDYCYAHRNCAPKPVAAKKREQKQKVYVPSAGYYELRRLDGGHLTGNSNVSRARIYGWFGKYLEVHWDHKTSSFEIRTSEAMAVIPEVSNYVRVKVG